MDCFHDFCLACDKACVDGPYCSQACKLLDLEKANVDQSPPTSPRNSSHPAWSSRTNSSTSYTSTPAYGFDSDRLRDSYFARSSTTTRATKTSDTSSRRLLSPSSSHTSLSSTSSTTTTATTGMTEQTRAELQSYFSTFDQVRAARRRSSLR